MQINRFTFRVQLVLRREEIVSSPFLRSQTRVTLPITSKLLSYVTISEKSSHEVPLIPFHMHVPPRTA